MQLGMIQIIFVMWKDIYKFSSHSNLRHRFISYPYDNHILSTFIFVDSIDFYLNSDFEGLSRKYGYEENANEKG
jgi:hypothetical protein